MDRSNESNTRRIAWYSIIRYVADVVRGEILNVGLVMNIPNEGILNFYLLSENNSKLKSAFNSYIDKKNYKLGYELVKFKMNNMIVEGDLFYASDISSKFFIDQTLSKGLPKGFVLGDTKFCKTSNTDLLFKQLLSEYIGEKFLNEESGVNSMIVKKKAATIIGERINLENKVKNNLKIKPIKNLPKNYTIDFGYAEGKYVNLIQSSPDKLQTAYDWLERMNFLTENYDKADKILFLYNGDAESNNDGSMKQILEYLKKKDNRIDFNNIFSDRGLLTFKNELVRIEKFAKPIDEIDKNAESWDISLIS